jgi:hypothetical protein
MATPGLAFGIVDTVENETDKETNMYQLDTNINTAIERQADRVRAVQAYGTRQMPAQAAPSWAVDDMGQTNPVARQATLALAAAASIGLIVVLGLLAH